MATTILVKRNTTNSSAPSTSDLEIGELSLNLYGNNEDNTVFCRICGEVLGTTETQDIIEFKWKT